ncbi:MAG: UDP-N-acetylglucosamine 2-epimerase (non-hydrolyzing) [Firmicutes bacterium]|nr:UDP-N-acetylglucosamine 2-epimerase (non-hydrolyzing) [Bacillota bacterium]
MQRIKIVAIFGTRPEAIKMAPLIKELERHDDVLETIVAVTAQHRAMLDQVLNLFNIVPKYDLGIMREGQSLSDVITRSVLGLEGPLTRERPDMTLVHGDTATTFGGALISFYHRIPVGHVEAGLRTRDKYNPFPEEMNRRLTGVVADLHFAPTRNHKANLLAEKVEEERIFVTGNTVIDALLDVAKRDAEPPGMERSISSLLAAVGAGARRILLVTAHRRENLGGPMEDICLALRDILRSHGDVEIVFPVHKNPAVRRTVFEILGGEERANLIEPVDYWTMVYLMKHSYFILTDSGGLQEEAPSLGKPVLVLREVTERPEGVEAGTLRVVGTQRERVVAEARRLLDDPASYARMAGAVNPYGDGRASARIVQAILYYFGISRTRPEPWEPEAVVQT